MIKITDKQRQVLRMIKDFIKDQGVPPTRKEISKKMGWSSANAAQSHLNALERKGYLKLTPTNARAIVILVPKDKK